MKRRAFLITGLVEYAPADPPFGHLATPHWRWSAGAGKDTVAEIITRNDDRRRVVIALADPLKRIVAEVYGLSADQVWGARKHEPLEGVPLGDGSTGELLTSRHAQVKLGTEWGRGCSEHTWTRYLCRVVRILATEDAYYERDRGIRYVNASVRPTAYVIPDVRFRSELAYLREHLAPLVDEVVTVRVRRRTASPPPEGLDIHHPSEADLVEVEDAAFDWVIENDCSLPELYQRVQADRAARWP